MTEQERKDIQRRARLRRSLSEARGRAANVFLETRNDHGNKIGDGSDGVLGAIAAEIVIHAVNAGNASDIAEGMFEALMSSHRTLQQQTICVLLNVLKQVADKVERCDLRNKASVDICRSLFNDHEQGEIILPFI